MLKIKVKELLERNHMSRYKLQKITNWNYKRINSFYKSEIIKIKVEEIETLCEIFKCKIEDLMEV